MAQLCHRSLGDLKSLHTHSGRLKDCKIQTMKARPENSDIHWRPTLEASSGVKYKHPVNSLLKYCRIGALRACLYNLEVVSDWEEALPAQV